MRSAATLKHCRGTLFYILNLQFVIAPKQFRSSIRALFAQANEILAVIFQLIY